MVERGCHAGSRGVRSGAVTSENIFIEAISYLPLAARLYDEAKLSLERNLLASPAGAGTTARRSSKPSRNKYLWRPSSNHIIDRRAYCREPR